MATDTVISAGGWIFSVATAYIAYKAATRKHHLTTRDSDKSVYVEAVTNERAKWREELRRSVSDFAKECIEAKPNLPELLRLKTDIVLRLNPRAREKEMFEKHKFDAQILDAVNTLFQAVSTGSELDVPNYLGRLEEAAQELLKHEWEKSKNEAITGRDRWRTPDVSG